MVKIYDSFFSKICLQYYMLCIDMVIFCKRSKFWEENDIVFRSSWKWIL